MLNKEQIPERRHYYSATQDKPAVTEDTNFMQQMLLMVNQQLADLKQRYAAACAVAKEWEDRRFDWPFEDLVLLYLNGYTYADLRFKPEEEVAEELLRFKQVTPKAPTLVKRGAFDAQ
jgi:hypothetical protein